MKDTIIKQTACIFFTCQAQSETVQVTHFEELLSYVCKYEEGKLEIFN
jgi:hypothetical protein